MSTTEASQANPARQSLEALLTVHGRRFWEALFAMIPKSGLCPRCTRKPVLRRVGPEAFCCCDWCAVYWNAPSGTADELVQSDREAWNEAAALLAGYALVDGGVFPLINYAMDGGGILLSAPEQDGYFSSVVAGLIQDREARDQLIQEIVALEDTQ